MKYRAIFEFPLLFEVRSLRQFTRGYSQMSSSSYFSRSRNVMKSASRAINSVDAMQYAAQLSYFSD